MHIYLYYIVVVVNAAFVCLLHLPVTNATTTSIATTTNVCVCICCYDMQQQKNIEMMYAGTQQSHVSCRLFSLSHWTSSRPGE
jgi:hypothetical protein